MEQPIGKTSCAKCGEEAGNLGQLACSSCGTLLSRLKPGIEFYRKRFRIERLLRGDRMMLAWLVYDQQVSQRRVLLEYPGAELGDVAAIRQFVHLARVLQSLQSTVVPPLFPFTLEGRFYLVEAYEERPSLKARLAGSDVIPEEQVREVFFKVLDALEHLHSQTPALFHGNLALDNVLLAEDGSVLLRDLWCPGKFSTLLPAAAVQADLRSAGVIAAQLLCGTMDGSPEPPSKCETKISAAEDPALGATIEWLLGRAPKQPTTVADVRSFFELVRKANEAELAAHTADALKAYDQAYNRAPVPRLRTILDTLKAKQTTVSSALRLPPSKGEPAFPVAAAAAAPLAGGGVQAPAQVALQKICPKGHGPFPIEHIFCEICSARLQDMGRAAPPVIPPAVAETPVEPSVQSSTPLVAPQIMGTGRDRRVLALLALGVVGIVLSVYVLTDSLERDFDAALKSGNLVSTTGRSAYVIYHEALQKKGPRDSIVVRMNQKAGAVLDNWSREKFHAWYRTSTLIDARWEDVARIEEWRNRINSTPETKANLEYALGMSAFLERNYREALQRFIKALQHRPNWALGLNAVGRCYFNLRDFQKAEQYYRQAADSDPNWSFPVANLANLYRDVLRNDELAETHYRKAIALDPSRASFHYELATLYYARGPSYWPQACEEYRKSLLESSSGTLAPVEADVARRRVRKLCQ